MWINISIYAVLAVHVICSLLLILIVLMQRPRSEGLGAAFGSTIAESAWGAGATDVLTKGTIWLGTIFFAATLLLAVLYAHRTPNDSKLKEILMKPDVAEQAAPAPAPAPAAPSAAAPSAAASTPAPAQAAPAPASAPAAPSTTAKPEKPKTSSH